MPYNGEETNDEGRNSSCPAPDRQKDSQGTLEHINQKGNCSSCFSQYTEGIGRPSISAAIFANIFVVENLTNPKPRGNRAHEVGNDDKNNRFHAIIISKIKT